MDEFDEAWWRDIIYKDDGTTIDEEQVMRELHDYSFLMEQAGIVYCDITDGLLSKTTYYARDVLQTHEQVVAKLIHTCVQAALDRVEAGEDIDYVRLDYPEEL